MLLEDIIDGCKSGDRKAQKHLYERFSPRLFGICRRYFSNRAEAEDLLQAGFIRIFQAIVGYKGEGSFEGWLIRIMINQAIDQYRKRPEIESVDIDGSEAMNLVDNSYDPMDVEDLLRLILELPARYRLVFNLYAIEGYSHQEIALRLNITEGTSKSQLSRARALLRIKLEKGKVNLKY